MSNLKLIKKKLVFPRAHFSELPSNMVLILDGSSKACEHSRIQYNLKQFLEIVRQIIGILHNSKMLDSCVLQGFRATILLINPALPALSGLKRGAEVRPMVSILSCDRSG